MLETWKIWQHQGKQYIPDVTKISLPDYFKGLPVLSSDASEQERRLAADICPTQAIESNPFSLDLGKCVFCGACMDACTGIRFTPDYRMAANTREGLIRTASSEKLLRLNPSHIRAEIRKMFSGSLKLRQISAGGNNADEIELNASMNVNFDIGRWGIEFVASPRHADGLVITGPITQNMAEATEVCIQSTPEPKLIILAGTGAISGGIFADSPAIERRLIEKHHIDLYIPGNPVHPLTFVCGILDMLGIL